MRFFVIVLHGNGFQLELGEYATEVITGFYTTSIVYANTEKLAIKKVKTQLFSQWRQESFYEKTVGTLELEVDNLCEISLVRFIVDRLSRIPIIGKLPFNASTRGYTFYIK